MRVVSGDAGTIGLIVTFQSEHGVDAIKAAHEILRGSRREVCARSARGKMSKSAKCRVKKCHRQEFVGALDARERRTRPESTLGE